MSILLYMYMYVPSTYYLSTVTPRPPSLTLSSSYMYLQHSAGLVELRPVEQANDNPGARCRRHERSSV